MADSKECQYITKLSTYDVLCGRGSGPNEQEGNINFRDLVATRKAEYLGINPRDHKNKTRIAREIVDAVRSRGGRFLKRADVENVKGRPKPYELADEPAVLEKAKQALRQNRTGWVEPPAPAAAKSTTIYAESHTSSMMHERATHLPPTDPYQAFVAHLQQTSMQQPHGNGMRPAPAEAAMRNAQIQSFMAAQRQHETLGPNPYFAAAGAAGKPLGVVDPRNTIHELNNAISGQQKNISDFGAYEEANIKEYIRHAEQKMTHNVQPSPGVVGRTPAGATSIRQAREQHYETSVTGVGSSGYSRHDVQMLMADDAASMRHSKEQHYEAAATNTGISGHSPSDERMILADAACILDARKQRYEDLAYKAQQQQQQQQQQQHHHHHHPKSSNAISGQEQHLSNFEAVYGDAAKSEYSNQVGQQMKITMHPSPRVAGRTAATTATHFASMRLAREQQYESSVASIGSFGHSIIDAQMQYQQSDSRPFHHQTRSTNSESFIDGLEDMSLPSMSVGDISDFSAMERVSVSRSKRSVGGTIIEGGQREFSIAEVPARGSFNYRGMKSQENTLGISDGLSRASVDREYDVNRHVSFLDGSRGESVHSGSGHSNSLDELASVASAMHRIDANPPPQCRAQVIPHLSDTAIVDTTELLKLQRQSLSSYYRVVKATSTTQHDAI